MFKRKADKEPKKDVGETHEIESVKVDEDEVVKTTVEKEPAKSAPESRSASKKTTGKAQVKKTANSGKKAAADKGAKVEKKTSSKASSKTTAKNSSKTTGKTSVTKKSETEKKETTSGTIPLELKGLNKQLKAFAERSKIELNAETANAVFTEYMAKVFRDLRYRMLMIKDANEGTITMLGNTTDDISVKDKIMVKCVYMKKGSVTPLSVEQAQSDGAFYHADETWCVTTTDFTDSAIRKSRKQDAKVRLIDGKKLYKLFISELEND